MLWFLSKFSHPQQHWWGACPWVKSGEKWKPLLVCAILIFKVSNPLGSASCLPLLLCLQIFLYSFYIFINSISKIHLIHFVCPEFVTVICKKSNLTHAALSLLKVELLRIFFFFAMPCSLQDLGSQAGSWAWAPVVEVLSPNHWTNRVPQTPGNINQSEVSWRSLSQHQDLALPNCLQIPVLEASGQTTSKTGTQPHPSKKRDDKKICHRWRSKAKTYTTK